MLIGELTLTVMGSQIKLRMNIIELLTKNNVASHTQITGDLSYGVSLENMHMLPSISRRCIRSCASCYYCDYLQQITITNNMADSEVLVSYNNVYQAMWPFCSVAWNFLKMLFHVRISFFFFFSVGEKMQGKIERPLCCGLWLEKLDINPRLSRNFSPLHWKTWKYYVA